MLAGASGVTRRNDRSVLLLNSPCLLRESFEGYKACVAAANSDCTMAPVGCSLSASFIIAPAAALARTNETRWLRRRAEGGALVLVESGGMFLSAAEFRRHQSVVQSAFGVTLLSPVELWQKPLGEIPYVDFIWPGPARIRDFSRFVALAAERRPGNRFAAIAHLGGAVAAVKIRAGGGTLIFLGSPLGPHLLSGDREAWSWFQALATAADSRSRGRTALTGFFDPLLGFRRTSFVAQASD